MYDSMAEKEAENNCQATDLIIRFFHLFYPEMGARTIIMLNLKKVNCPKNVVANQGLSERQNKHFIMEL